MQIAALLLFAGSVAVQTAPNEHAHAPSVFGSPEEELRSLALNIDSAIKVCTEESALAASGRKKEGKVTKRAVDAQMLRWASEVPPRLVPLLRGRAARLGQWFDPHATIWLIAYDSYPSCRILVTNSPWTTGVRPVLYAKIQDDAFWKVDEPERAIDGGLVRATFRADLPPPVDVQPIISVTAPTAPKEGDVQLNIGVSLIKKEN